MAIDEPHSNCKPRIYHTHKHTHRHPKITEKLNKSVHITEKMSKMKEETNKQTNKNPIIANHENLSLTHTQTHTRHPK